MLSAEDREIAREVRGRLSDFVTIEEFRVYGSRARGDAADDSDFDVYVVVEDITPALRQRIEEVIWEVGFERSRVISAIVVTRDQVERGAFGANPLLRVIEREGVAI